MLSCRIAPAVCLVPHLPVVAACLVTVALRAEPMLSAFCVFCVRKYRCRRVLSTLSSTALGSRRGSPTVESPRLHISGSVSWHGLPRLDSLAARNVAALLGAGCPPQVYSCTSVGSIAWLGVNPFAWVAALSMAVISMCWHYLTSWPWQPHLARATSP